MPLNIPFDNSYARLPERFYVRQNPVAVAAPKLIRFNAALADELGLNREEATDSELAQVFSGNLNPEGAEPLAQAYAGHQFGGWSPQLGDGRALLLGEIIDQNGHRRDIQLKGSGPTPFSRMGDGRAWLGPVLREYVVSEAMHAMGIPTTRALAAVETGEQVFRETTLPGAILTRVASSHIRVGTFQFFAARGDVEAIQVLTDHVIARHYPHVDSALELLGAVIDAQADLVARWLGIGFIHGVMNTDNCHIGGETIDYGPCAFMDRFEANKVFSSIDQFGRYAYDQQPDIAMWNLAQFATCLLPLIDEDKDIAVKRATKAIHAFPDIFTQKWLAVFRAKLGLTDPDDGDKALIHGLQSAMQGAGVDFTNFFRALTDRRPVDSSEAQAAMDSWMTAYQSRLDQQGGKADAKMMERANPVVIPRNHRIEEMITTAIAGNYDPFERLLGAVINPFDPDAPEDLRQPPAPEEEVQRTFCGT
ncbi:protein adenylyltransferase SelO [Qingshengfaniella alkalisoli]|uniref:Protein nucleotidyltransferase YdiU n=1 Tax=Qingshengfaniella alkalisoli TaxID=2599296 RepID=A0A5B8IW14_9RHOB|nr:YdiU family protein [Qingshengfaniella alkalisoli]QDY68698.1 YdiU family protein [Qingshengfaniella alkalisoli]